MGDAERGGNESGSGPGRDHVWQHQHPPTQKYLPRISLRLQVYTNLYNISGAGVTVLTGACPNEASGIQNSSTGCNRCKISTMESLF